MLLSKKGVNLLMKRTRFLAAIMSVTMISSFVLPTVYAEKEAGQTPEEVEPVQWVKASEYENYNEIEVSRELREALVIPGDPKDIKIMAAKDKKGFLYLLDRMPAALKFEPVSGKPVNIQEISAVISKDCDIPEKEFKVQIFQTTVSEGNISKIVDEVSVSFNDEYYLNKDVANAICSCLVKNEAASKVYYQPAFYNSAWIEVHTNYPQEYSQKISEILKENDIEAEVKTLEGSSEYCKVIITDSYESEFRAIELIYAGTGQKTSVSAFLGGTSAMFPVETELLYSDKTVTGDIDLNGTIDVTDLTELSLALVGDKELTSEQKMAADVDGDGAVTLADLARLRQYLSKKIESLDSVSSPAPTPEPTVASTSTPTTIDRPQIPDDYIWPINRENHTFDYATLNGKAYTKRCVHTFDESTLDEKTRNAFFESTVERTGLMASVKTVSGISSEDMFLLKCGNEEGKYYVFLNENLTEEEAKKIYDQFGITEYTTPEPATFTEPEQPIPTSEPTVTPTSTPAYIEREPFPEGYIDPVNREDNPYNYATYKGNTYTKRCIHVFDETQFDEKTVNPFITKNRGGVMEFAKTVKGISSEIMFLVKCGNEEGRYFVFLNENLTDEEAKKIYDQFGITEYSTPEPLNITEPTPEQPIPTPVPTTVPAATDD